MNRRVVRWVVVSLGLCCGCAAGPLAAFHPCLLTTKPILHKHSVAWQWFDTSILSQIEQGLDLERVIRKALGRPRPSHNLHDGIVPDSSFLTNRDLEHLNPEAIRRGPTQAGQEAQPPFVITRMKTEGKTAGFFVRDAQGDRYLFKLDVVGSPELLTGAEVVTSKLLYALGYAVPSYEIVNVTQKQLTLSPTFPSETKEQLARIVASHEQDGVIRVSASRFLDGEILGPFSFKAHRHCTELRALKLAYAWVNNTDAKDQNTLMVWAGTRAIGYLIDFGSSLGAYASRGSKGPCQGWVNDVDLKDITLELLTLGLHTNGCDSKERPWSPAVGLFSPRLDPIRWKPYAPNVAFEEITKADAQWMIERLAKFSRTQLDAAVSAGQYAHREDAQRIVEILEARRQAILQAYPINPEGTR